MCISRGERGRKREREKERDREREIVGEGEIAGRERGGDSGHADILINVHLLPTLL